MNRPHPVCSLKLVPNPLQLTRSNPFHFTLFCFPYPLSPVFATRLPRGFWRGLPRTSRGTKTLGVYANNSHFGTLAHKTATRKFVSLSISSFDSTIPSLFCSFEGGGG